MALVMTQVYLEANQKKALAAHAKRLKRKPSDLLRDAVDALLLGVSTEELKQLDEATKRTAAELNQMIATLDANAKEHKTFMTTMARLRKAERR
jgi:hypothetical protein